MRYCNVTTLLAMVLVLAPAWAEEGKFELHGSSGTTISSQYLNVPGKVPHDEIFWETSLKLKFGDSPWYVGYWSGFPLDKKDAVGQPTKGKGDEADQAPSFENEQLASLYELTGSLQQLSELLDPPLKPKSPFEGEVDLFVGYNRLCLNERLRLDARLSYFAIGDLGDYKDDHFALDIKASLPKFPVLQPYAWVRAYGEISSASPEPGFFYFAGLTRNQPLGFQLPWAEQKQTLDLDFRSAWSDGALGGKPGYVWSRIKASSDFPVSDNLFITPSLAYQFAGGSQNGEPRDYVDGDQWVVKLGVRLEF